MGKAPLLNETLKIVLLENIHPKAQELFQAEGFTNLEVIPSALKGQELIEKTKDANIICIRSRTHIGKEVLSQCQNLHAIGCFCIGTNQVDLQDAMLRGIPVFNDPHSNTRSVAELVIGLCIVLLRDLFHKNADAHMGKWKKITEGTYEIRGKTLGIVGYGRIGSQLSILAEAMGMNVCYYDVEQRLSIGTVRAVSTLEELLSISDIVSLHVPETPMTKNMINRERLSLMKKSAYLINTSRGKVVDLDVLAEFLKAKTIKGAAIDVFHHEPEDSKTPFVSILQKLDNVILTPHIAGATEEAQEKIALSVTQKLVYYVSRGSTEGAANFPSLSLPINENSHRILHIHENIPGMLSSINKIFADRKINILAQYLKTIHEIGYVVFDVEKQPVEALVQELSNLKGSIRARILY